MPYGTQSLPSATHAAAIVATVLLGVALLFATAYWNWNPLGYLVGALVGMTGGGLVIARLLAAGPR